MTLVGEGAHRPLRRQPPRRWPDASDVFTPGSVYDKPFVEAYDDLSRMKLLPLLGQSAPYGVKRPDIAAMTLTRTSDSLNWRIAIGPNQVAHFTARLTPIDGSRTRVFLSIRPAATEKTNAVQADEDSAMIVELARVVMTEQVDARLEDRAPDTRAMALAMARYITTDQDNLRTFGEGVEESMNGVASHLKESMKPTERWTPPPTIEDASRPSVKLPPN